jgi:2-polyprenyl-3-methyl-5-hydroxy-6-metoxy-1,4-benzoquinol methylase
MNSTPRCPVCNSSECRVLFSISSHNAAYRLFPKNLEKYEEIKLIIEKDWGSNLSNFYTCRNCSFGFANPFKSGSSEFYSTLYYSNFDYPSEKWEYKKTIELLQKKSSSNPGKRLLEIGAGNGSFIKKLLQFSLFQPQYIFATEYSDAAVKSIQSLGIACSNKNIYQLKNISEKFDIICMFQVLEHLDSIDEVFDSLNKISVVGADLIIAIPNSCLRNFLDKSRVHYDIPPVHVGKYSLKSFNYLAEKFHWQVVSHEIELLPYKQKIHKFLVERYFQNTYSNWAENIKSKIFKKVFRYLLYLGISLRYIFVLFFLIRKDSGTSLWVHLKKSA